MHTLKINQFRPVHYNLNRRTFISKTKIGLRYNNNWQANDVFITRNYIQLELFDFPIIRTETLFVINASSRSHYSHIFHKSVAERKLRKMSTVKLNQTLFRMIRLFYLLGIWGKEERSVARKLFYLFYYILFQVFLVTIAPFRPRLRMQQFFW